MDIVERAAELLGSISAGARDTRPGRDARAGALAQHAETPRRPVHHPASSRDPASPQDGASLRATQAAGAPSPVTLDQRWMRAQRIITPGEKRTVMTETFRRVKRHVLANIAKGSSSQRSNLVMVTSALSGEGKTFCAVNLAMSLSAEVGRTVLLVDADFEHPGVPEALGLPDNGSRGFMDLLADPAITLADVLVPTDMDKLTLLPAGTPQAHATELLSGERPARLLDAIAGHFADRIVVFDTAPLLAASESCALAALMGQIVLVVEAGRTTENAMKEALARIESCNVAGVILNKGRGAEADGRYRYGDGHAG